MSSQILSQEMIQNLLAENKFFTKHYQKNEFVFNQNDAAEKLTVLVNGVIRINRITSSGKKIQLAEINKEGELFGEVFFFLDKKYDFFAEAETDSTVLHIPRDFFEENSALSQQLTQQMLTILSSKAYFLNQKLQILSGTTLRQKIIRYLINNLDDHQTVTLSMTREKFSEYLGVARPSLSRELMAMQTDNLIQIKGKQIKIISIDQLDKFL